MRNRRQRGVVAVEAALVTPIIIVLLLGIIEYGLVFKDMLAVSSSVRAGARMASAEPRIGTFATDAVSQVAREGSALDMDDVRELWVYKAADDGTPVGGSFAAGCTTCVKFTWDGSQFVPQTTGWTAIQQNACQGDANRDRVGVYLKVEHHSISGLLFDKLDLSEHTVMALEPIPTTQGCKP